MLIASTQTHAIDLPTPAYLLETGRKSAEYIAVYDTNYVRLKHEACTTGRTCTYETSKIILDSEGRVVLPFDPSWYNPITQAEFDAAMATALHRFEKQAATGGRYA